MGFKLKWLNGVTQQVNVQKGLNFDLHFEMQSMLDLWQILIQVSKHLLTIK